MANEPWQQYPARQGSEKRLHASRNHASDEEVLRYTRRAPPLDHSPGPFVFGPSSEGSVFSAILGMIYLRVKRASHVSPLLSLSVQISRHYTFYHARQHIVRTIHESRRQTHSDIYAGGLPRLSITGRRWSGHAGGD